MTLLDRFAAAGLIFARHIGDLLLSPGSLISVWSLGCALMVAMAVLLLRRKAGKRLPRFRVWRRALFPKAMIAAPSTRADLGLLLFNTLAVGALFGWAMLAATQVGAVAQNGLIALFGARSASGLPEPLVRAVATLVLFLAYEIAYWLDHYTSHKIPFFWAFHKTHHTAQVLTPLTAFRVHPVDSLKFGNISALIIGGALGVLAWVFGGPVQNYAVNGVNLLLVAFIFLLIHLQHSQLWIATTGRWACLILSPAHHQVHHSANPAHFDRNFGSTLAVWDWMAGTLYAPAARREPITFGAGADMDRPHSVTGTLITPFIEAATSLKPASPTVPAGVTR